MSSLRSPAAALLVGPRRGFEETGTQTWFYLVAVARIPYAIVHHRKEIARLLTESAFGTGALAMIGGTVAVTSFMTAFAGMELGIQGYDQLASVGIEALSGFTSAFLNTRLAAPVIASITLVATIGAGFTAQIGAMRVAEEVDALEVMAIPTLPFLVSTRIVAGMLTIVPVYAMSLIGSYAATRFVVTVLYGQSSGAYEHYFRTFLMPGDIVRSLVTVLVTALVVMAIHCYYGFYASGGPAGVGVAVGRAVRLSLVAALCVNVLLSLALYGTSDSLHVST